MAEILESNRPRHRAWPGYESAAMVAFVLLSLAIIRPINIGVAVAATLVLVGSRLLGPSSEGPVTHLQHAALGIAWLLILLGGLARSTGPTVTLTTVLILPLVAAVAVLSLKGDLADLGRRWLATALLVVIVAWVGMIWILVADRPEIDVLDLHVAAADALATGDNPYIEARVPDTSPTAAPGDEVVGYPYPPLTLFAFAGSRLLFGDPRWAAVIAVALTVVLIARPWGTPRREQSAAVVAIGLAVAVQPVMGHIFRHGWTEPIALPLLVGAAVLWRKHPAVAAVLLGLAFGTKQYWIVALPLLLAWSDEFRWKRFSIAGGVAALSLGPAFLADAGAAWDAIVVDIMELPTRSDSISLAGIGWDIPFWLVLGVCSAVAFWMGRRGGSAAQFLLALTATVAVAFLLGSQAFLNYWFLIATLSMAGVAIAPAVTETSPVVARPLVGAATPPG